MTKAELLEAVIKATKSELSKAKMGEIIDATFERVGKSVKKEGRFSYPGFGTFSVKKRKARTGRNPKTGETIKIKASKTIGFRPAPKLKGSL